jgi:hypothetical protein
MFYWSPVISFHFHYFYLFIEVLYRFNTLELFPGWFGNSDSALAWDNATNLFLLTYHSFHKIYSDMYNKYFSFIFLKFLSFEIPLTFKCRDYDVFKMHGLQSELIVFGCVKKVKLIDIKESFKAREHIGLLTQALIDIMEILKGNVSDKEISVLFYNSYDIAYDQTPKLKVGDKGVYFLNKFYQELPLKHINGYGPLRKGDFFPINSFEKLQKIIDYDVDKIVIHILVY